MTFQNDPNINRLSSAKSDTNYTGWIAGVAVAILVTLGIFMMYDRNGMHAASPVPTMPKVTTTAPLNAPPSTTGSAVPTAPTAR